MKIDDAFTTEEGKQMAYELIEHMIKTEKPENLDECLHALKKELGTRIDRKLKVPYSAIFHAEIKHKLIVEEDTMRYTFEVNGE